MRAAPQLALDPRARLVRQARNGARRQARRRIEEAGVEVAGVAAFLQAGDELVGEVVRARMVDEHARVAASSRKVGRRDAIDVGRKFSHCRSSDAG